MKTVFPEPDTQEKEEMTSSSSSSESSDEKSNDRESWSGRLDFFLSSVGYAVGIGNILRFPYLCYKNGGGAFLIPYLTFMIIGALPIYFLEYAFSQFTSSSTLTVWRICPLMKGVGYGALIVSAIFSTYFNIFLTWVLYFLYQSLTAVLPWSHCNNSWNSAACYDTTLHNVSQRNTSVLSANTTKLTASEEYWRNNVLKITNGIENMGGMRLELLVCLFLAWLLVFVCLCKGIKSSGKIVYITVTFPYIVLLIFLVRAVTLPGAIEGIKFFVIPKWHKMLSTKVWGEAAVQIFYSSGAGWGGILTFASFNKFHHNIYRDAMIVPVINSATSIFAGFVTFSVLGFMAQEKGMKVDDVVDQGPGLAFVAYPEAISRLPISPMWSVLFFLMMLTIAIDTQFGTIETIISALIDQFPSILRSRKTSFTALLCLLGFILDFPFIMEGGMYVLQIVDWYCGLFTPMTVATIECIVLGWVYGADRFMKDIEMMIGYKPCIWWAICWKFITPGLLVTILIFNMSEFQPVSYNTYQYPAWAIGFGWIVGLISVIPIPLYILKILWTTDGTILERIKKQIQPTKNWGPALNCNRKDYGVSYHAQLNGNAVLQLDIEISPEKQNMLTV